MMLRILLLLLRCVECPSCFNCYWRRNSKYHGGNIGDMLNLPQTKLYILYHWRGVQNNMTVICWTPFWFLCLLERSLKYYGREILTTPLWFSLLFDRGFKILWLRYIESSSISDCFWRERVQNIMVTKYLPTPFCFQIPPGEGVQNIMAAFHWTPYFSNS